MELEQFFAGGLSSQKFSPSRLSHDQQHAIAHAIDMGMRRMSKIIDDSQWIQICDMACDRLVRSITIFVTYLLLKTQNWATG